MTVNISFSGSSNGDVLPDTVDLGAVAPSESTAIQDLFIRHDGVNPITDCAFYIQRYVGEGYLGEDEDSDIEEIMSWGDDAVGGATVNQVPPPSWVTGEAFASGNDQIFKTGFGDVDHQLQLLQTAITTGTPAGDGVIPADGEGHIQLKVDVPSSVPLGAAYRAFTFVLSYSATS